MKLSGGTFRLSTFGNYTQTDVSQVTPAFHCRATGVPVEIASDLILTGERHFLQAEGSDVTFSGTMKDADGSRKGTVTKFVENNAAHARFTLAGTCAMWGRNGEGVVFTLRNGTNVVANPAAIATGSQAAGGRSGVRIGTAVLELSGGTYKTTVTALSHDVTTVFKGDTVLDGHFLCDGEKNGTKKFVFDGASSVQIKGDVAMGTVQSPHSTLAFEGTGAVTFRVDGACIASKTAENKVSAFHCDFWVGPGSRFGGNHWSSTDFYFQYDTLHALAENVFDPKTVVRWGYYANNQWGVFDLNGFDQTINRFAYQSIDPGFGRLVRTDTPARLTLKATASDFCFVRLSGPLTLVYDAADASYVQTLSNLTQTATGEIVVSNGTLRLAGSITYKKASAIRIASNGVFENASTEVDALADVPTVTIEAGGVFRQAVGAANPFGRNTVRFDLQSGATIAVEDPDGLVLSEVWVDGVLLNKGRYQSADGTDATATRVDWLAGVGVVDVAGLTVWKEAVTADWSEASRWDPWRADG